MAVRCSKCGEELLGPVNRCWKCGQTFATLPDTGGVPPVRREPSPVAAPVIAAAAAVAPAGLAADGPEIEEPVQAVPADGGAELASTLSAPRVRTGSPFSPGAATTLVQPGPVLGASPLPSRPKPPATQDLIRDQVAVAGAIGSLVLGGFGVAVAWMQNPSAIIGGALIAILGLGMGMWGLHSKRRGWALFGMLICVFAISLASYSGAMMLYQMQLEAKEMEGLIE
ncbi:MAG TPA: hypothetical protein VMP01_08380 [Pirellulaceae bacterium]|nr:hypothetical protein [Pirellulaceae bacterium]